MMLPRPTLHLAGLRACAIGIVVGFCLTPQLLMAAPAPRSFLQSCTLPEPTPAPLFAGRQGSSRKASDETEAAQDPDGKSPSAGGFVAPGTDICIKLSGTVTAGLQRDAYKASTRAAATGLVPRAATSFPLSTIFRLESASTLSNGVPLTTAFEFQLDTGGESEMTLNEAGVTLGPWQFGLASSRFDFWSGDEFVFIGRIPSRTVGIIAYELAVTDEMRVSVSMEDASTSQPTTETAGSRVPDGVVKLLYETDALSLHGAAALRDVPAIAQSSARLGRAAIVGATLSRDLLGQPMTLSGQIAGAVDAAAYIGSRLDRRTVLSLLSPDDVSRGWSAVASVGREWTKSWATNAYLSRYELSLPRLGAVTGRIRIDRFAGNLVWSPADGLRAGIEASVAWQKIALGNRTVGLELSGRQSSFQAFVERSF